MKTPSLRLRCLLPMVAAQLATLLPHPASASPFYDYKIVAQSGQTVGGFTFQTIKPNPSINANGQVAFIGVRSGGQSVFSGDGATTTWLSENDNLGHKEFDSVSINNNGHVATTFFTTTAPWLAVIRRYRGVNNYDSVACAGSLIVNGQRFWPYDTFLPELTMNDTGTIVYAGVDSGRVWHIANNSRFAPNTFDAHPVISQGEWIVFHTGIEPTILAILSNFTRPAGLTTAGMGFTRAGHRPGIGGDGQLAVFYGELSESGATSQTQANHDVVPLPVTPGPGIFASASVGEHRHLVRVAGKARNGHIDPGERWVFNKATQSYEDLGQDFDFDGKYTGSEPPHVGYDY